MEIISKTIFKNYHVLVSLLYASIPYCVLALECPWIFLNLYSSLYSEVTTDSPVRFVNVLWVFDLVFIGYIEYNWYYKKYVSSFYHLFYSLVKLIRANLLERIVIGTSLNIITKSFFLVYKHKKITIMPFLVDW